MEDEEEEEKEKEEDEDRIIEVKDTAERVVRRKKNELEERKGSGEGRRGERGNAEKGQRMRRSLVSFT